MSTKQKKSITKSKRYTPAEKQAVVDFVNQVNAQQGRGGQATAAKKFGISVLSVSNWLKDAGVAKAPKAAKAAKAPKPAKAPKAAAKKAGKKVPQGTRYSEEHKQVVLDFVAAVNATKNGRGGMSAAVKKFNITPLTIAGWIRKYGLPGGVAAKEAKAPKAPKAVKASASAGVSPKMVIKLQAYVTKIEASLNKLKAALASV
jgi:transposase-like protein